MGCKEKHTKKKERKMFANGILRYIDNKIMTGVYKYTNRIVKNKMYTLCKKEWSHTLLWMKEKQLDFRER